MKKMADLSGKHFDKLTVLKFDRKEKNRYFWVCQCECGKQVNVNGCSLKNGHTKSCGCYARYVSKMNTRTHGMSGTRFYNIWRGVMNRCYLKSWACYREYGAKSIVVKKDWHDFNVFKNDMYEKYLIHTNIYGKKNTSIDRIDSNKNYCLENCRWATPEKQANNISTNKYISYNGQKMTIRNWEKELNFNSGTLWARLYSYGWPIEKALTTPVKK